jgi:putative sigma-54 modulation protein
MKTSYRQQEASMAVRIYGHHVNISETFRDYIESKVPRLEKYTDKLQQLEIVLEEDGPYTLAELRMKAGPLEVNVKHKDPDQAKAIDLLIDKAERALKKQHDMMKGRKKKVTSPNQEAKKANFSPEVDPLPLINTDGPSLGDAANGNGRVPDKREMPVVHEKLNVRIFRSSKDPAVPMSVQEAAEELYFKDENFLCFTNTDTEQLNIIYRRKDGNFALMQANGRA